jgi:aminomethyltransferase
MWSPMIKASIALASIDATAGSDLWAEIYYQKELKWNRTKVRCRSVDGPFYTPARRRQTPAPDL